MSDATPPPDDIAGLRAEIANALSNATAFAGGWDPRSASGGVTNYHLRPQLRKAEAALATLSARIEALERAARDLIVALEKPDPSAFEQHRTFQALKALLFANAALLSSEADHE